MSTDRNPLSDKELWRTLAIDSPAAPMVLSELDFAAWLEGRLSEAESARIEAAVAADPELRRSALELSDILGKPLPTASSRMAVRAQALIGFEAERQGIRGGSWLGGLLSLGAVFGMPRAAMATLAAIVAISGFVMGGGLGDSYAQERYVVASNTQSAAYSTNELTSFFATDGI